MSRLRKLLGLSTYNLEYPIDERVEEAGEIPENTCPDIDKGLKHIKSTMQEVNAMYQSGDDVLRGYSRSIERELDYIPDILEELREDNQRLRELGIYWYEKCKEICKEVGNMKVVKTK